MANQRLFLNDVEIELTNDSTSFSRTLQVNDLISLQSRQSSYTKNIKIPRTPTNSQKLGFIGEFNSTGYGLPSQKLEVTYIVDNEYMIYKGWGVVEEVTDTYIALLAYDGLFDLYKAVENLTLADLDIDELEHSKTVENVLTSMTATTPYKYITADYGGKCTFEKSISGTTYNVINIDYMIPSVLVRFFIDKIFTYVGATYNGIIFNEPEYRNLYMTYSNGYTYDETPVDFYANSNLSVGAFENLNNSSFQVIHNSPSPDSAYGNFPLIFPQPIAMYINKSGYYRLKVSGQSYARVSYGTSFQSTTMVNERIYYKFLINDTKYVEANETVSLNVNDTVKAIGYIKSNRTIQSVFLNSQSLTYQYISGNQIDFRSSLKEFTVKDFLNEFIYRFGLTIYKDKYEKNYTFKMFKEILNVTNRYYTGNGGYTIYENSQIPDLSDKFVSKINEKYTYGSYAKNNKFTYKYNVDGATYNDTSFYIDNVNLSDEKVVLASKLYSTEENKTEAFKDNNYYNQYLLWEKEIDDVGVVNYKVLTNHFHFLNAGVGSYWTGAPYIGSELTNETVPLNYYYGVMDYMISPYVEFERMMNDFKIIRAKMNFTLNDINNFDFSKLYYVKQLGGYYLVNKIQDYQLNKNCIVELLRYQ